MKDGVVAGGKPTFLSYLIEGFDSYDEATNKWTNVYRITVIARTEKEAMHKAKLFMKCNGYKLWGVTEYYANTT